jgi:hypothetical protein
MDFTLGKAYEALNFLVNEYHRTDMTALATEVIRMPMHMRSRQGAQT